MIFESFSVFFRLVYLSGAVALSLPRQECGLGCQQQWHPFTGFPVSLGVSVCVSLCLSCLSFYLWSPSLSTCLSPCPFLPVSRSLSVCLSLSLSLSVSVCLSLCLSLFVCSCLCLCPSVCVFHCLRLHLSLRLCFCLSLPVCLSAYVLFCLRICLSALLSVCLSFYLSVWPPPSPSSYSVHAVNIVFDHTSAPTCSHTDSRLSMTTAHHLATPPSPPPPPPSPSPTSAHSLNLWRFPYKASFPATALVRRKCPEGCLPENGYFQLRSQSRMTFGPPSVRTFCGHSAERRALMRSGGFDFSDRSVAWFETIARRRME